MNYNVNNENERIIIGEVGENLAESCTIDYSAWVEEYGEGNLRIRAIREGDAEPYPVANVETADGVATWTYTAADTAVKGFGEVQVLYYVGDVLAKSRVWKTYTYRSLNTSSEEVPDPYADWLNAVERIGGQVEADAEAASASADSASASATLAAGSASEAAESALSASRSASAALGSASAASSSAESAASSATAASRSATEASNYEYYSEQYMNEAKSAKFGAESARTGAENAKAAAQASATAAAQSAAQAEETAESIEASADLIQKLLANQIHDTATGTIASFPDGADMPMVSLVADIDPIQDTSGGAPSPSHICPISGWDSVDVSVAGKNLLRPKYSGRTHNGVTYVVNDDGTITASGTASGTSYAINNISANRELTSYLPAGTYRLTGGIDASKQLYLGGLYDDGTAFTTVYDRGSGATYTFTKGAWVYPQIVITNGTTINATFNIQFELGSTATSYEPYDGQTITTPLPTTVYGGTLDVVSGVLTVDRAMVTLDGTESSWAWISNRPMLRITNMKEGNSMSGLSDWLPTVADFDLFGIRFGYGNNIIYLCKFTDNIPTVTDLASFKTYIGENNLTIVYELATPTTIQLTPQQIDSILGRNSVWADSGDVTVEYIADTKLYIQKVIS